MTTEHYENNRYLEGYAILLALATMVMAALGALWHGAYYACLAYAVLSAGAACAAMYLGGKLGTLVSCALAAALVLCAAFGWSGVLWYHAVVLITLSAVCLYLGYGARQHMLALREAYAFEHGRFVNSVMIDSITELKTRRAYQGDASIYLRLARRNKLQVALLVWRFDDEAKIRASVGETKYPELLRKISSVMRAQIRYEDISYMLDTEPRLWGAMMVTQKSFIGVITDRQRHALSEIQLSGLDKDWADTMRVGAGVYDGGDDISPLTLYDNALKSLKEGVLPS